MKPDRFEVTYEVEDGYVGGSRPQHMSIRADDLEDDMDDNALKNLFYNSIQEDFEQEISWVSDDEDAFVEWAKKQIAKRNSEEAL